MTQGNGGDAFQDPRAFGEPGPDMEELSGRTVAFVVKEYDPTAQFKAANGTLSPRPDVTVDVYVLDGPALNYGGSHSSTDASPPTHTIAVPCVFRDRKYGAMNVVTALRDYAPITIGQGGVRQQSPSPQANGGPVVGMIERSTIGGKPWNLTKLVVDRQTNDPRSGPAGEFAARRNAAGQIWNMIMNPVVPWVAPIGVAIPNQQAAQAAPYGQWPQGAAPVNPQAPQQQAWGAGTPQAPQQQAWGAGTPQAYGPTNAQAGYTPGQYSAPPAQQAPAVDPGYAAWQAQQAAAAANVSAAPAGVVPTQAGPPQVEQDVAPVGYEAIWPSMLPDQKAAIRAAVAGQQAAAQGGRPNPY